MNEIVHHTGQKVYWPVRQLRAVLCSIYGMSNSAGVVGDSTAQPSRRVMPPHRGRFDRRVLQVIARRISAGHFGSGVMAGGRRAESAPRLILAIPPLLSPLSAPRHCFSPMYPIRPSGEAEQDASATALHRSQRHNAYLSTAITGSRIDMQADIKRIDFMSMLSEMICRYAGHGILPGPLGCGVTAGQGNCTALRMYRSRCHR